MPAAHGPEQDTPPPWVTCSLFARCLEKMPCSSGTRRLLKIQPGQPLPDTPKHDSRLLEVFSFCVSFFQLQTASFFRMQIMPLPITPARGNKTHQQHVYSSDLWCKCCALNTYYCLTWGILIFASLCCFSTELSQPRHQALSAVNSGLEIHCTLCLKGFIFLFGRKLH